MHYFTQLNLNHKSSNLELDLVKTPMPDFQKNAIFKIDSLKKRAIFIHKDKGIFTKELKGQNFATLTEPQDHDITKKVQKSNKNSPVRFKGRTTRKHHFLQFLTFLELKYDVVAIDCYLDNILLIKKIYNKDNHTYNYSLQHFQEKNNFFYLKTENELKQLILFPHEMIFEGKLQIVGRIQESPLFMISFKHIVEDVEYIYTFRIENGEIQALEVDSLTKVYSMKWQDYLLSFYPKNRIEFSTTVMGSQINSYQTDLWVQKTGQDQTKSFFDRFHFDWLYSNYKLLFTRILTVYQTLRQYHTNLDKTAYSCLLDLEKFSAILSI